MTQHRGFTRSGEITSSRVRPAAGVASYLFEDQLLVFSENSQTLYNLNPSAAFVWCCFEEGMNEEEAARELVLAFGVAAEQARHDVRNATDEWQSLGLIETSTPAPDPDALPETDTLDPSHAVPAPEVVPPPLPHTYAFELAGLQFLLRCSHDSLMRSLIAPLAHLAVERVSDPITIDVFESDGRCMLIRDAEVLHELPDHCGPAPVVAQEALQAVVLSGDFLICLHAAVHSLGGDCIVFPGVSGTGKTTLSAALIKDGFRYFTDEVALLDRRTLRIVPAPVSLRVKEGSWQIVSTMFPQFSKLPSHIMSDGSGLRLLPPPCGSFARNRDDGSPVKSIVFASYAAEEKTAISPISRIEGLHRIQQCGYALSGRLDRATLTGLLDWLSTVDCYTMTIGSLPDATAIVRELLE